MERFILFSCRAFSHPHKDIKILCGVKNFSHCSNTSASINQQGTQIPNDGRYSNLFQCRTSDMLSPQLPSSFSRTLSTVQERCIHTVDYIAARDRDIYDVLSKNMTVQKDFLNEEEESSLLDEVDRYMKRLRYEFDHWDNAIHGYRETEKASWNEKNSKIISRVQNLAFGANVVPLPFVHVLDISKEGYIKPHVDAVRFCGHTIAGMCLLSSCVMRLALEKDSSKYGDIFLPRRCLYIMKDRARYEFTHEVLKNEDSKFRNDPVPRDRRISIICRCEPDPSDKK